MKHRTSQHRRNGAEASTHHAQAPFASRHSKARARSLAQQLRILSRQAGTAEVATSTLHNVGNVLTSLNVSTSLIRQRLRQNRIENLSRALALLREHQHDLTTFLSQDPKGQMLPAYLENLATHFATELEGLSREFDAIARSIDHMNQIVSVQQSYARRSGVCEALAAAELVQDALTMNLGAFERHGIQVVTRFEEVPSVFVDRHKVLQILINLLRNAKYAIDQQAPAEKQLTITMTHRELGPVLISVSDNGVGIAPGDLRQVFEHGFTTRSDGHGLGLWSSAMAAKEMGGRLLAFSEGIGKGAMFCLELPVAGARQDPPA